MSTEIRKLKDGSITVLPLTVGSAVNLDDGTTVQDLADRSNKNQIKLNRNEPMRVVVAKCIPQHPKIGMRYYYPGGVFGVKYKKKGSGDYDQDFIKLYYILYGDGQLHEVSSPQNTSYFLTASSNDVPGIDYDRDEPSQDQRKPYLLVEIVDSTIPNCHQINTSGGEKFYCTVKQVWNLNCDTYSPYLKVINGKVVNVEKIEKPKRPASYNSSLSWKWLAENFPKNYNVSSRFQYYKGGDGWGSEVVKYNRENVDFTPPWFYEKYNLKLKRNKLIHPKGSKCAKFSLLRNPAASRDWGRYNNGTGRTFYHIRKAPYAVKQLNYRHVHYISPINGYNYHVDPFAVHTFRRSRKSVDCCFVQAVCKQEFTLSNNIYNINTYNGSSGYRPIDIELTKYGGVL